jgi:NTP pyrophosphatase (non-canonical NTP hydrolase)
MTETVLLKQEVCKLQTEIEELTFEIDQLNEECDELRNQIKENTIIESMNDMRDEYNSLTDRFEELKEELFNVKYEKLDYNELKSYKQETSQVIATTICVLQYIKDSMHNMKDEVYYQVREKFEKLISYTELLEDMLKNKTT